MSYVAIKDLKRSRTIGELLEREREIIVTRDGRPFAIMVGITPDSVEQSMSEIRRAMFSSAVMNARKRASTSPPTESEILKEVTEARAQRKNKNRSGRVT
jgi:antitoxin (DNA-binding transcriptional repressor) of toxin-antitoxin stability system